MDRRCGADTQLARLWSGSIILHRDEHSHRSVRSKRQRILRRIWQRSCSMWRAHPNVYSDVRRCGFCRRCKRWCGNIARQHTQRSHPQHGNRETVHHRNYSVEKHQPGQSVHYHEDRRNLRHYWHHQWGWAEREGQCPHHWDTSHFWWRCRVLDRNSELHRSKVHYRH